MEIKISIIYSTNRVEPKINWFLDSLRNQTNEHERSEMEIIIIRHPKASLNPEESKSAEAFPHLKVFQPKDSLYCGDKRKTKTEMFSPSSARNTGIIYSNGKYLVFVDDVSVLMPGWWAAAWQGYVHNRITCGSYWKQFDMVVENGNLISSTPHDKGRDSRWSIGADYGAVKIPGTSLFGCSLGIPAADIMQVNGFDELCDSIGGEDYQLGVRLTHAGKSIYYDRKMFTIESEELHNQPYLMLREDRVMDPERYMRRLDYYQIHRRVKPNGNWDSSHMILDILYGTLQTEARYNFYRLDECRALKKLPGVPEIEEHWFDSKKLSEI